MPSGPRTQEGVLRFVARYQGRHRSAPASSPPASPSGRSARRLGRPLLAGALTVGLVGSGVAYAKANDLIGPGAAALVVGAGVAAQTDEPAGATALDVSDRAAASVSRNERRTAIASSGAGDATELEAQQKVEAARRDKKAKEAKAAADRAARENARKAAIENAKKNPKAAARVLLVEQGWTSNAQYKCLVNLWTGESDWRWWAENRSSGAYGIPQSLPARKMATMGADYRTNPITQMKWGLWYIKMSYGTPCNAWSFWQSNSPHWY
jgi:hypothetical protein